MAFLAGDTLTSYRIGLTVALGVVVALFVIATFLAYERWRFSVFGIQAAQVDEPLPLPTRQRRRP